MPNKQIITNNFDSCAGSYDEYALPQKKIAQNLTRLCKDYILNSNSMLEIGCGTGLMTNEVYKLNKSSQILATDISSNMINVCASKNLNIDFLVMDGENPTVQKKYDFIYSNLVFQWFNDLSLTIKKYKNILNKNSVLAFTTLTNNNFPQWQDACNKFNLNHSQDIFLTQQQIIEAIGSDFEIKFVNEMYDFKFDSPTKFLHHICNIGARGENNILSIPKLRNACKYLNQKYDSTVSYDVVYVIAKRK